MTFKAQVCNGRIKLDEPTDLPDGVVVELVAIGDMTAEERQELEQALAESEEDVKAGRVFSGADVIEQLRRQ